MERQVELEEENKVFVLLSWYRYCRVTALQVLAAQLKEKADECESRVASAEREAQEALEDKKRADFMNNQAQLQVRVRRQAWSRACNF